MARVILVTVPSSEADHLAETLVRERLAACVSVLSGTESHYRWEGRLQRETECQLVIKTADAMVEAVTARVHEIHSYDVPELLVLPVESGSEAYLAWIDDAVSGAGMESTQEVIRTLADAAERKPEPEAEPTPVSPAAHARVGEQRIVLLGPPGAGKSSIARRLADRYGLARLATRELLAEAAKREDKSALEIRDQIAHGRLVSDERATQLVRADLEREPGGRVFDGYPRTAAQAEALDSFAPVDTVFYLNAPEEVLLERLTSHLVCDCGADYGPARPPKHPGLCDACGYKLYRREDDRPENARTRLAEYREKTRPLLFHYRDRLHPIDASASPAEVFASISAILEGKG